MVSSIHLDSTAPLYLEDIPREAIDDMSASGDASEAVEFWVKKLNITVDREDAVRSLREYGAWDDEELSEKTDEEIAGIVLWIAAGDFSEFISHAEDEGIDPYDPSENFHPTSGSSIFTLGE